MMRKLLLAAAFLLVSVGAANAQFYAPFSSPPIQCTDGTPNQYFVVATVNPTTQVYKASTGAYIANSDATYQAWLATSGACQYTTISNAVNNGSGLVRLTVGTTASLATGQVWAINGVEGVTAANGVFTITVIDATHIDLQGSTFSGTFVAPVIGSTWPGMVQGPIPQATDAALRTTIGQYAAAQWQLTSVGVASYSGGLTNTITNPMKAVTTLSSNSATINATLPAMNLATSPPMGAPLTFVCSGLCAAPVTVTIYANDGATVIAKMYSNNDSVTFTLIDNSSATGAFRMLGSNLLPYDPNSPAASGRLLFGQGTSYPAWITATGDVTNDSSGAFTIANAAVSYAKIQNLGALSVMGRATNSSGVGANISATAASDAVLRESGSGLSFGTVATAGIANNAVTLAKLATQATNTVLGNATSGAAVPTALSMTSCSTAASAVSWTTNTGFACNTSITAATLSAVLGPALGGTGVANNAASTLTISGNFATTLTVSNTTSVTLPTSGTLATLAGSEELTNKTLNASVGKGTWTTSGTWTLPAHTLGGTISGGGNNINNVIIGASTPLAGTFTTLTGTAGSLTGLTTFALRDTSAAFDVTIAATSAVALTAGRTLTLSMSNVAHTVEFGTTANTITFPSVASDTVTMIAATQELTNKTLNASVGKGTWTASGTWTIPAVTLGGTVSGGGNQINNVVIGASSAGAGTFSTVTINAGVNVGLFFTGSVSNVGADSYGIYQNHTLTPASANNAYFYYLVGPAVATGGNTITNTYGYYSTAIAKSGGGTMTNVYGLYLENQTAGGTLNLSLYSAGDIKVASTTEATSATAASTVISGGVGIAKKVFVSGLSTATAAQTSYLCRNSSSEMISVAVANNCATSAARFKFDIQPMPDGALAEIAALKPKLFRYREAPDIQLPGFLADDAIGVDDRLVTLAPDGSAFGFRYEFYTAVLTKAMQELNARVDQLERNRR